MPLAELARSPALDALAARGIALLAAVFPHEVDDALALVERARARGVAIGLWPMLPNEAGRWLHPGNAPAFERFVATLVDALDARGLSVDTVALDLEPPIAAVRRITDGRLPRGIALDALRRPLDDAPHRRLIAALRARDVEVIAAALPPALLAGRAGRGWQRALGTPLEAGYDVVSAMLYTSLFEGYSFGALRRDDARALLHRFATLAAARPGASVSLGAIGVGALGDERHYRDVTELRDDVAIARASGIDDLALFDLAGAIARAPIEPWLDALVDTPPASAPPPPTPRARALVATLSITGVALDRPRRASS